MSDIDLTNYATREYMRLHPDEFEKTADYRSRRIAMKLLNDVHPGSEIMTFKFEDYGPDIICDDRMIEVKSLDGNYRNGLFTISHFDCEGIEQPYGDPSCLDLDKLYYLTAESFDHRFMENCKWASMLEKKEDLMLIFRDGWMYIDHQTLLERFIGYGRCEQNRTTSRLAKHGHGDREYLIRALFDLDGLDFNKVYPPFSERHDYILA